MGMDELLETQMELVRTHVSALGRPGQWPPTCLLLAVALGPFLRSPVQRPHLDSQVHTGHLQVPDPGGGASGRWLGPQWLPDCLMPAPLSTLPGSRR